MGLRLTRPRQWTAYLLAVLLLSLNAHGQQADLKKVRQAIEQKKQELDQQLNSASALEIELQKDELQIAKAAQSLNQTQIRLSQTQARLADLKNQQLSLQQAKKEQQHVLAQQLKSAFMTGRYDYAKLLFNQKAAGRIERSLTYYQYLNKARQENIEKLQTTVTDLAKVEAEVESRVSDLDRLQTEQLQQRDQLTASKAQRSKTLAKLQQQIQSDAAQIEQLQFNEQNLVQAIYKVAETNFTDIDLLGLEPFKGRLNQPTQGRLRRLFGSRRQGQVRWKGVMIYADEGKPVNAIQQGKVLFADWLKGFGLVIVLDHGEGYMSLYGHNQAILKQVGETVERGETLALVGQSGGQSRPGLYFEIRHKGEAINPSRWLAR